MKDRVSITMLDDGIADVRFIRTDKMNALDPAMFDGINEAIAQLKETKGLRVVVVSGRGAPSAPGSTCPASAVIPAAMGPRASPAVPARWPSARMALPIAPSMWPGLARNSGAGHRGGAWRCLWRRLPDPVRRRHSVRASRYTLRHHGIEMGPRTGHGRLPTLARQCPRRCAA